ncbi:low temperature requirement protein A [Pseudonocardia humida]|uniref:Low temperature requirement protein A n=1 Tax=Pseudonocardia humida TaxID=2800819 RepID=A0ABT1A4X5_9PSEU|nr:low temperature requirement protein A [Pseudonocardia humida]MCO1658060.1 low temperature requirement protein A [Pseudonocardia humida]
MGDEAGRTEGWLRPPRLATGEERSATRLELFYDLAYVLVVAELAAALLKNMTWGGVGIFAGLFTVMWFSWVSTTLYANRFDTDDVLFRIALLTDTAAVAGCAAAATGGLGGFDIPFAVCFLIGRLILVGLYLRAWWHVRDSRATIVVYLTSTSISATLWAVSLLVPPPARYVLWGVAVLVEAVAPFIATWRGSTAPLHMEHLPERFGLFVILVLGEVVAGIVTGVHDAAWAGPSVTVAAVAFVVGAGLWWIYFDAASVSGQEGLKDGEEEDEEEGGAEDEVDERHDLYIYGHLPLTLGIAAAGVGLEDLVLHPDAALPSPAVWIAVGGVALAVVGAGVVLGGVHQRLSAMWPWPVAALVPLAALTLLGVPVLALVGMLAAIVVIFAVAGARQKRSGSTPRPEPAPAAGTE